MRAGILVAAALVSLAPFHAGVSLAAQKGDKPNIIFILSDDVGLGNISCYGGAFKTPRIDALAAGGTRFEYSYALPVCGPSRCECLTGRYAFRTGLTSNSVPSAVQPGHEIMMPTVLKKAGYVTACVGKWGQMTYGPVQWGFDESLSYHGSGRYWRKQTETYDVNGKPVDLPEHKYLPDIMHKFVVDFVERHKDQPFYVYYSLSHMHAPIVRTPDDKAKSDDLYGANNDYMDKLVGQLIDELDRLQLREKTLVVFAGDNGTARVGNVADRATVDGKRLSGEKGTMLEGGSRVPLIVNWPGTTPAGKVNHDLTDFSDFFVTFADLAGAPLPKGVKLDGHSFAPQIKGETGNPREWVYVEYNGKRYVRGPRFKLTGTGELFDMKEAPFNETLVPAKKDKPKAEAARKQLQEVLVNLVGENPNTSKDPPRHRDKKRKKNAA